MYPGKQVHFEKPLRIVAHCVFGPHGEGLQGFDGNLQGTLGGCPSYSGKQKHTGAPFTRRHPLFGPH